MPRFYFHLRDDMFAEDPEGLELPDVEAARTRAGKYALDMSAASVLEHRKIDLRHRIEVADERGQTVFEVAFGDVVTIEG